MSSSVVVSPRPRAAVAGHGRRAAACSPRLLLLGRLPRRLRLGCRRPSRRPRRRTSRSGRPGPLPCERARARRRAPCAIRRATGDAFTRPLPSPSRSASGSGSASLLLGRDRLGLLDALDARPPAASAPPSSPARSPARRLRAVLGRPRSAALRPLAAAALADLRDRRRRPASVSPSWATIFSTPGLVGLVGHVGLVGLDLDELLAALDLVPVGLEPLEDRALLHGVGQAGHRDIGHARKGIRQAAQAAMRSCSPGASGSVNLNVAPPPGVGSTQIRPPWRSTIRRQVARPIPVPS